MRSCRRGAVSARDRAELVENLADIQIIEGVRTGWNSGRSRPLAYRKNQIKQLGFLIQDNEDAFVQALASDVRPPLLARRSPRSSGATAWARTSAT